jgi:hypothetical protein
MKVGQLKKLLNELPEEMEVIVTGETETGYPAAVNVEERTLANKPGNGFKVFSPIEYPRYISGQGRISTIVNAERLTNIRLERCLVVSP